MVGWHHRLNGHGFEQALGVGDGQGGLACCSLWGHKEWDTIWVSELNWVSGFAKISFIVVQLLSHIQPFVTPWTTARQAFLSFTVSCGLLKLMSTESMIPSYNLILYHPRLLLPSIFSNESPLHIRWPKYWSFSIRQDQPKQLNFK